MIRIEASTIVQIARSWVGVPFQHQGRTRFGVDCIGLVLCVRDEAKAWPVVGKIRRDYPRNPSHRLLEGMQEHCEPAAGPAMGRLVLLRWRLNQQPSHIAILTPDNLIHSYQTAGRVVETGFREPWTRLVHSYWKIPGVIDV